jgi:methylglutaconyl-CoA hydratase
LSTSIDIQRAAGIVSIALARPELHNAFDETLVAELTTALASLAADDSVRALVLTGLGNTFSAGADLEWMRRMAKASHEDNLEDALRLGVLLRALAHFPRPVLARVNGSAYGGGVGLIACCDIAIGVESAKFALSEVKLGLAPAMISPYVMAAIGARQARRFFLSGEVFDAAEATRIGLLHQCVAASELDAMLERQLHFLLKGGPAAQAECKRLILDEAMFDERHAELIARLRASPEGQEGMAAFLERRAPGWTKRS